MEWGTKGKVSIIIDGQFGSTGKGLAAAYLAHRIEKLDIATTNAGANAGHTTRYVGGYEFVCFHLPTHGVVRTESLIYVNAGSILDPIVFPGEIYSCGVNPERIVVHPRAAIIMPEDSAAEHAAGSSTERLASTQKGVGAAISNKVMRRSRLAGDCKELLPSGVRVETLDLNSYLSLGHSITVEVPQGFDLSLNHGLSYPYTTSRDCWVGSGLNDAGINPRFLGPVCMTVRTFPIRVGNIVNEIGETLGTSGPFYPDSTELSWERDFPGVEPERTTVTKRIRRIASFSVQQYARACSFNQPDIIFLNFCNYLKSSIDLTLLVQKMERVHVDVGIDPVIIFGFGPCVEDVTDDYRRALDWYY